MNHPYPKSNSWFHFPVKCRSIVGLNMAVWGWTLFPAEWFCAFAESETAQFFFVVFFLFVSFSLLFTSLQPLDLREQCWWVWQRSGCAWAYQKKKKEKKRKAKQRTRNQSSKETSEGIAQFQDWSVRFLRQKRSLKVLIKNTQRCHITIVLSFFFKPIGSSLLEKKSTHANIMHAIKIHQDKTGYSSRAFN